MKVSVIEYAPYWFEFMISTNSWGSLARWSGLSTISGKSVFNNDSAPAVFRITSH